MGSWIDRNARNVLVLTAILFVTGSSKAQESQPGEAAGAGETRADSQIPAPSEQQPPAFFRLDYSGDLATRPALTGDWSGVRNDLAAAGISFEMDLEQSIQGVAHGGNDTNNGFRYAGSLDFHLKFDTGRMGLWEGGLIEVHGETLIGDFLNTKVGSLVNDDGLVPLPGDPEFMLPHVVYTQFLSSNFAVFVGKLDMSIGDENEFAWAGSKNNFMHQSMRWNPVTARTTPYSTLGAGAVYFNDWVKWTIAAYDTEGVPNLPGFDTAFDGGTTFATEARFTWEPFGRKGHQLFGFVWSDKRFNVLEQDPRIGLGTPGGLVSGSKSGSWAFYYNFDQYVYQETEDPTQGIGIFGRFGVSDGNANPIEAFYSLGVGGKGIIPKRDQDRFGVGYFHTDYSDTALAQALGVNSAQGVEMFYNFEVTPWMHITPDLQILVDPGGVSDRDVAIVYGLRMEMSF